MLHYGRLPDTPARTKDRKSMRALVTGASGFVGSHLAERLLAEGAEVVCQVRTTSRRAWLEDLDVEFRTADLRDADAVARAAAGVDHVFHVAALLRARTAEAYAAVNVEGTRHLLRAVERSCPNLQRFVYVSSLAAAGPCPSVEPLDETAEARPMSHYGSSKLAAERVVLDARDRLPVTVVRPPAVYGPRDESFLSLFKMARRLRLAPVIGSPDKELSLVHVADLVECLWLAAAGEAARGEVYFVGSGTYTWARITDALEAAFGHRLRRLRIPRVVARLVGEIGELKWTLTRRPQVISRRKIRDMLQERWTCSWAKAERDLGYRPRVPLDEGMRQALEWYASRGWIRPLKKRGGSTAGRGLR